MMLSNDEHGNDLPEGVRIRMSQKVMEGGAETKRKPSGRFQNEDRKDLEPRGKRV